MQSSKPLTISISGIQHKLKKSTPTPLSACYLNLYQSTQHETIYLIGGPNCSQQQAKNSMERVQECTKCMGNGREDEDGAGLRSYDQKNEALLENRKTVALIYRRINTANSIIRMAGKMGQGEVTSLAIFLIGLVSRIKESNAYFGTFRPERIFKLSNQQYCVIGGQMYGRKCSTLDFISKRPSIKGELATQWKYQAPEMFNPQGKLDYMSDLFVVGCMLHELITGEYPYGSQKELMEGGMPTKSNHSQFTKQICKKILNPKPTSRSQPQDLLHLLALQRGKSLFNTCKLNMSLPTADTPKPNFFNNFQEFIMKCTTETEGWFLYYCENSPDRPNDKYLEQILNKIVKKNEKITKLAVLIQKCAAKPIKQENMPTDEDNSCSMLKMAVLILNLLRKVPGDPITGYYNTFTKVSSKIVTKKCQNKLILIIFKVIAFKISLGLKFGELNGNFHLAVEGYERMSMESVQYLAQYCLKILTYLKKYTQQQQFQNLRQFQTAAIACLCDQVYDGISTLLFTLMAMKKDSSLKLCSRQQILPANFKKIDALGTQIVGLVGKLCSFHPIFSCHEMYSINSDYYQYQEELCLMFCPIVTSYQYFYLDKNYYKGLGLPKNYGKLYESQEKQFFGDFQQQNKYSNRKPMLNRIGSLKQVEEQKPKPSTNSHKINIKSEGPNMKSQGQGIAANRNQVSTQTAKLQPQTEKKISSKQVQEQVKQFEAFLTNINVGVNKKEQSNSSNTTNTTNPTFSTDANVPSSTSNPNDKSNQSLEWFEPSQHDIFSYQWLKKTEKIISKHFQKPELDGVIYLLYEDICKGLKLHQLIDVLGKNKKVIINPNEILFQKVIGSGSAGEVYIGKYRDNVVAIKKVKTSSNPNALKEFQREVMTYIKIKSHPSLVSLVGLTKYNQDYFLLTQFCQGGSLFDLLHKKVNQIALSWSQRLSIALDIARGMEILHYMNPPVIHRDLKSLNVFMINRNGKWLAKVADFGLSRSPDTDMMTSALGTLHWMAPELLCNKQYSLKVDVYSFAVVLWEICSRRTPYHNIPNQMGIVKHVALQKGRPLLQLINQGCPQQLIGLMCRCWSQDPESRPYFPEIVAELEKIPVV